MHTQFQIAQTKYSKNNLSDNQSKKEPGKKKLLSSESNVGGRIFVIDILLMSNGCFASISEDLVGRIGAITVAVKTGERSLSSALIPESKGRIFSGTIGEMLAEKLKGIAVVSLYLREELDTSTMKTLINEVRNLVNKE
jgi:hypothetical protein